MVKETNVCYTAPGNFGKGEKKMAGVSKKITDDVVRIAENRLKELGKDKYVATKLQAVISAKKYGITKVADVFNISRPTLFSWIKHVKEEHLERLKVAPGRGRKKKLTAKQIDTVNVWIKENSQLTIDQVKLRISQEFNVLISRSSVHRIIQSLNFSYITPRPKHHKQDPLQQEEFKKN